MLYEQWASLDKNHLMGYFPLTHCLVLTAWIRQFNPVPCKPLLGMAPLHLLGRCTMCLQVESWALCGEQCVPRNSDLLCFQGRYHAQTNLCCQLQRRVCRKKDFEKLWEIKYRNIKQPLVEEIVLANHGCSCAWFKDLKNSGLINIPFCGYPMSI